jgi:hypothetical protein
VVVAPLVGVQFTTGPNPDRTFIDNSIVVRAAQGEPASFSYAGKFGNADVDHAVAWFEGRSDVRVLGIPNSIGSELEVESNQNVEFVMLPYLSSEFQKGKVYTDQPGAANTSEHHLLFLTPRDTTLSSRNKLFGLTQEGVLGKIERRNLEYVVTTSDGTWGHCVFQCPPGLRDRAPTRYPDHLRGDPRRSRVDRLPASDQR